MKKNIHLENRILNDEYTKYIYESFDIQDKEKTVVDIPLNLDLTDKWNIGVVYGGSGSGKTTILKEMGEVKEPFFSRDKALISNFDFMTPQEATHLLSSMGLSSVPAWLRPFHLLSNGEQFRAKIAMQIAKSGGVILVDEYTSVVDRDVAKAMSFALQKYIRKTNKKIILASCHFDIVEWLMPDWIYSPLKGRVEIPQYLRRPDIELQVFRCRYETWNIFKPHHYLTQELNKAANCYCVTWNNKQVAFMATLELPNMPKKAKRVSRLVVLPDYQGLSLGSWFLNYMGSLYAKLEYVLYIRTVTPALGEYLLKNKQWSGKKDKGGSYTPNGKYNNVLNRPSYSAKYIGELSQDDTSILEMNIDAWRDVAQNQLSLII